MLTARRLPVVQDHLKVVLRPQDGVSDHAVPDHLEQLRSLPTPSQPADPLDNQLKLGALEVVAIYAIFPPVSGASSQSERQSLLARIVKRVRMIVHKITQQLSWIRWGFEVPFRMSAWMHHLIQALEVARTTSIYDAAQHGLQTMCVAKGLQGKGVGSAVMRKLQVEVAEMEGAVGIQGLCQSESTRDFYVKAGFQAVQVYTHPPYMSAPGTVRKHYFVAWECESSKGRERVKDIKDEPLCVP